MEITTKNEKLCFGVRLLEGIDNTDLYFFYIQLGKNIIGRINSEVQSDGLYIYDIYIDLKERQKGYATDLITFVCKYMQCIKTFGGETITKNLIFNCNEKNIKSVIEKLGAYRVSNENPNLYIMPL